MKQIWNEEELAQYWSLIYEELELLKTKPQKHHLIFCMQLKYYKYYGAFPENEKDISEIPLQYISEQLDISDDIFSYEWEIKRHPPAIRYALMSIFFYTRRSEIIDGLIELLIQIIHRLSVKAEKKVFKILMQDFRKVYGKNTLLGRIAEASLNNPDSPVREVVYPIAGVQTLSNLVKEYKSSGKGYQKDVHRNIRSSYGSHYCNSHDFI